MKIFGNLDEKTVEQINELQSHPMFRGRSRFMPDAHAGKGCVIGTTVVISDVVIPNVVGVDISCGMLAVKLKTKSVDFEKLDNFIRANIPLGKHHNKEVRKDADQSVIDDVIGLVEGITDNKKAVSRVVRSLGTLGGGNHFIEIGKDSKENLWLVIHTGSRSLGTLVAAHFQSVAHRHTEANQDRAVRDLITYLKEEGKEKEIPESLKRLKSASIQDTKDLGYLEGVELQKYLHACDVCNRYANENRRLIAKSVVDYLGGGYESIQCNHNYIDVKNSIVRKGAISAQKDEKVIIPLNMRDGIILGTGKGNADWNFSAPHGAGRLMSRREAHREVKLEDFKSSMEGIFSTCIDNERIDESPFAYKPAQEIIDAIEPTVSIDELLKTVYNIKG